MSARLRPLLTALGMAVGASLLAFHLRHPLGWAAMGVALGLVGMALVRPRWYRPVHAFAEAGVRALLAGLTWTLLGAVYFLVFAPGRGWLALRRRPALSLAPDPSRATYWETPRPPRPPAEHYRSQH